MKFKQFINDPDESTSLGYNNITSLFVDAIGTLWIGTSLTLEKYNSADENFKHYSITVKSKEAPSLLSENEVSAIYEDKSGKFWLGTPSGLVLFNRKSGDYNLFPHHYSIFRFGWGRISNILEDDSGLFWLATPGGLMIFDNIKKKYNYCMNDPLDPSSISYNSVSSIWRDRTGILWLGTPGAGINIYNPNQNRFSTFIRKKDEKSRITGFSVRAILEDNKEYVWISTDVLYRWNRSTGELKSYETSSDHPDDFGNTGARSIIQSVKGDLWFATPQGLFNYNPINEKSRQYKFDPMNTDGLPQREVFAVYEDHKGDIWIATENYFCKLTDYKKGTFKTFRYNKNIPKNEIAQVCIYEDTKSDFWLGTNDGLIRFVQSTGTFLKYRNDPSDPSSLNNNNIKSICPDPSEPEKFLWLGTAGGGLNKFNYKNKTFTHFTTKDNLPNNVVYGILPDEKRNLWLSTNRGLSMFNPVQLRFRNYDVLDGLQSNEFNTGAYFRSNRGELFFGGIKGINHFFPKNIKDNRVIPNIVITRCIIPSQSSSTTNENGEEIKSLLNTKSITLSYNENIFSFDFAAMDFSAPEKNRYAYKLENFNENWINTGTSNTATFTHLPPGKYVFRVKGSNNDGVWNNEGASLELIILPPWWRTLWAYALYLILFLSGLYFLRRYELNRVYLKNQLKIEMVKSDSLSNLNKLKSQFFANISHEFRTPLTLILGQIDSVLSSEINSKEKGKLHIANRNAGRLLTLINQLLDISKIEAGKMELKAEKHNIVSFLKSLFYSFESLAESRKITLKFESELQNIPVVFDPDKMEKVFYNLISNAFKFTKLNDEISVKLNLYKTSALLIRVKDTGIGIKTDRLEHIFDRFYQADNSNTREHEGTGIGLALAKELIELHNGKITVESKFGEGSEFIIELPLGDTKIKMEQPVELPSYNIPSTKLITVTEPLKEYQEYPSSFAESANDKEIILIVEDNADVLSYICEQLKTDYQVIEATDGLAGKSRALDVIPDLIITDVMMPKMDGYTLSREIRMDERTSHIPIIMLTAKAGLDDKIEGLETGIDDYLTKPFSAKELKVRVKNLIFQRRQLRKRFSTSTIIKPSEVSTTSIDQVFLRKTLEIIEEHFGDEQFSVDKLAEEISMSVSQLNRKLNALVDQPAGQLIRSLRLQRAADLLHKNSGTIAEICYKVGFNDQAYFSRAFKKQFGCSPSEYKKTESN